MRSSSAFVGRLKFSAVLALPTATFTLPSCVSSIFSKRMRLAPASTIAMATFQLFLRASVSAAAMAFFASSSVMYFVVPGTVFSFPSCRVDDPYGTAIVGRWKSIEHRERVWRSSPMRVVSATASSPKHSTPSSGSFSVKITVADALLRELERIGVDTVFGIISIHNIPFYDALERHGGFRVVTARHEGAAVNMADAYSRVSGKLGVALTSTGTGAGNAAGAIIESWNGGAPLLHITGNVASNFLDTGRGYIHDCKDQFGMLKSISKAAHRVRRAEQAPAVFRRAIAEAATPPPGPVSVEVAIDFQAQLIGIPSLVTPTTVTLSPK